MNNGFVSSKDYHGRRKPSFVFRAALILSIVATVLIVLIALTVLSANHLMNIAKNEVTNVRQIFCRHTAQRVLNQLTVRLHCVRMVLQN